MTHTTFLRRRQRVRRLQQNIEAINQILNPMSNLVNYIIDRLGESSTWRGIFMILTGLGIALKPDQIAAISTAGLSIVGAINVFRKEQAVQMLLGCLCILTLAACSTSPTGEKTFLGITQAGWIKGGKTAVISAAPVLLEERARTSAKQPKNVNP